MIEILNLLGETRLYSEKSFKCCLLGPDRPLNRFSRGFFSILGQEIEIEVGFAEREHLLESGCAKWQVPGTQGLIQQDTERSWQIKPQLDLKTIPSCLEPPQQIKQEFFSPDYIYRTGLRWGSQSERVSSNQVMSSGR